jgi:hypothetical protein
MTDSRSANSRSPRSRCESAVCLMSDSLVDRIHLQLSCNRSPDGLTVLPTSVRWHARQSSWVHRSLGLDMGSSDAQAGVLAPALIETVVYPSGTRPCQSRKRIDEPAEPPPSGLLEIVGVCQRMPHSTANVHHTLVLVLGRRTSVPRVKQSSPLRFRTDASDTPVSGLYIQRILHLRPPKGECQ